MADTVVHFQTVTSEIPGKAPLGHKEVSQTLGAMAAEQQPVEDTTAGNTGADDQAASDNNIFGNRDDVLRATAPKILYTLRWSDSEAPGVTKPSFYSSQPFNDLQIAEDQVSKRYQAPDELSELVVEVISHVTGTTERDRLKRLAEGYLPPPFPLPPSAPPGPGSRSIHIHEPPIFPPPPPPNFEQDNLEPEVNLYKLTEISISAIGRDSISIKSTPLRRALHSILKDYHANFPYPNEYEFPYMPLIHHRQDLEEFSLKGNAIYSPGSIPPSWEGTPEQYGDHVKKMMDHMRILLEVMIPYFNAFERSIEGCLTRSEPVIKYNDAWYLFRPGTDVYFDLNGKVVAGIVDKVLYQASMIRSMEVGIWYLAFDGKQSERRLITRAIHPFHEEKEVTKMWCCPASIWDQKDGGKRRSEFEARGRKIFKLCSGQYKQVRHSGVDRSKKEFRGFVIVDNEPMQDIHIGRSKRNTRNRSRPRSTSSRSGSGSDNDDRSAGLAFSEGSVIFSSIASSVENEVTNERRDRRAVETRWKNYAGMAMESERTSHHFFLFSPWIRGFKVLAKKWGIFHVDNLFEVIKNESMIDNVVMEPTKQNIIRAITHPQNRAWQLDSIQGKGEGQIVLLHGPPGVGKTYTVECAAEATGRPLISLTVADIGLDERRVEGQLNKWFTLAERWDAMILLDEADIFLERRKAADLSRNGLVAVFLRKLEYFRGLLFLTTNRVGQIDDSFLSRIHLSVGYPPLTDQYRQAIWNGFFRKLERDNQTRTEDHKARLAKTATEAELRDNTSSKPLESLVNVEISRYAKEYVLHDDEVKSLHWNGRDIRNAFQTAISLAGYSESQGTQASPGGIRTVHVSPEHFKSVAQMSKEFATYLDSVYLQEEAARAQSRKDRNDMFHSEQSEGGYRTRV